MGELELVDDDFDDDFVFEPTPWDIATAIGLGVDPEADREALDELADAMLVWADGPEFDALTETAVGKLWSAELAGAIRDGLVRVAARDDEWGPAATEALAGFDRAPKRSPVAHAVVQQIAWELGNLDAPVFLCLCCIDDWIALAPEERRRSLALQTAVLARRNAAVGDDESAAALAESALRSPLERLATDERRRAVRARLGRLGRLGRASLRDLATELRLIGEEPLPERPGDDDVWCAVCTAVLADVARPELN